MSLREEDALRLAPAIYKIVAGVPLLIFAVLALYWGWKNLCLTIGVLAVGFGASLFFLAMETTQPTIISEGGIEVGVGPRFY
jgi:hypothetical protein